MIMVLSSWLTVTTVVCPSLGIWIRPQGTQPILCYFFGFLPIKKFSLPQTQGSCHVKLDLQRWALLGLFIFWSIPQADTQLEAKEMVKKKWDGKSGRSRKKMLYSKYVHWCPLPMSAEWQGGERGPFLPSGFLVVSWSRFVFEGARITACSVMAAGIIPTSENIFLPDI